MGWGRVRPALRLTADLTAPGQLPHYRYRTASSAQCSGTRLKYGPLPAHRIPVTTPRSFRSKSTLT